MLNWIIAPPWEQEASDKGYRHPKKSQSNPDTIVKLDGGEIHVAKACAVLSREQTLLTRGCGRLTRWRASQTWLSKLDNQGYSNSDDAFQPGDVLIWMTKNGWDVCRALMCIKMQSNSYVRVDEADKFSKDIFILCQLSKKYGTSYSFENLYEYRAISQALEVIGESSHEAVTVTKAMQINIKNKISKLKKQILLDANKTEDRSTSAEKKEIIFRKDKLLENTQKELLLYCQHYFLVSKEVTPRTLKKQLAKVVRRHMKKDTVKIPVPTIENSQISRKSTVNAQQSSCPDVKPNRKRKNDQSYYINEATVTKRLQKTSYAYVVDNQKGNQINTIKSVNQAPSPVSSPDELRQVAEKKTTRLNLAVIDLPPVVPILQSDTQIIINYKNETTNVFTLGSRPPDSIIRNSIQQICNREDKNTSKCHLKISNLGVFDVSSLRIFLLFGEASETKRKLEREGKWLNSLKKELSVNKDDVQHAEELLWNTPWQETIISRDGFELKPETLSSLCDECFINDDIMNYFFSKLNDTCNNHTLSLTTHTIQRIIVSGQDKMEKNYMQDIIRLRIGNARVINQILIPLHMYGKHWGIIRVHMPSKTIWFDDGLQMAPEEDIVQSVRTLLNEIAYIAPGINHITSRSWSRHTLSYKRFGMPQQPKDGTKVGAYSCGVAVILSAKDFCKADSSSDQCPKFEWSLDKSHIYRLQLLNEIYNDISKGNHSFSKKDGKQ